MIFDDETLRRAQQAIDDESEDESPNLTEELRFVIDRGNNRRPIRPLKADNTKLNIIRAQRQWQAYTKKIGKHNWKAAIQSLSYGNRGLIEGFVRYLLRRRGSRIRKESSVRVYVRHTWQVVKKYTGRDVDVQLREHALLYIQAEIRTLFALCTEPEHKDQLGPDGHIFLSHFRWTRDTTTFRIGLDRIDDVCVRHFLMFAGARRHEFVFATPKKKEIPTDEYHDPEDAYSDVDIAEDPYMKPREKICWVCGETDERTEPMRKVLCWEDIELWVVRDPHGNGGRDQLAMQTLLRFHKGHDKKKQPTWYTFIEESLPVLCPVTFVVIKALAEGVIQHPDYQRAENLFGTKISRKMVRIPWKREFMHVPVFRKTLLAGEGFIKSNEPMTADAFDNNSRKLGRDVGMLGLPTYVYRRGNLQVMDRHYGKTLRNQSARHGDSSVYTTHYQNARMNAVFQDAFLGRGTESPYIAIFNYMIQFDENAPKELPKEVSNTLTPGRRLRQLDEEVAGLRVDLQRRYGAIRRAPLADQARYNERRNAQKAARQKQNRKALKEFVRAYFLQRDNELLSKQAQGVPRKELAAKGVKFRQPERMRLAELFGDMDEDMPEDMIVQRKIDTINAAVAYAWEAELGVVPPTSPGQELSRGFSSKPEPAPKPELLPESSQAAVPVNRPTTPSISVQVSPRPVLLPKRSDSTPNSPPPPQGPSSKSRKCPDPCIFCGQCFTRRNAMWDHVERHLKRRETPHVSCPDIMCKAKGVVLESEESFKAHALHNHNIRLREPKIDDSESESRHRRTPLSRSRSPKIVIKTSVSPSRPSSPKIVIKTPASRSRPSSPKIVPRIIIKTPVNYSTCAPCT